LKVIAVVGLSKNSGKTTFLNWYLSQETLRLLPPKKEAIVGVTTTGRDGEDIDLVTNDIKPKVCLPTNVYFTAFENVFHENSAWVEGVCKLPFRVIGKSLWLFRTLGAIETEIVGPSVLKEQEKLIAIFQEHGCDTVLIDGSLDRKSICLSEKIDEVVLIVGACVGNIEEIRDLVSGIRYQVSGIRDQVSGIGAKYESIAYKNPPYPPSKRGGKCLTLKNGAGNIVETNIKSIYSNESAIIDILNQNPEWVYFPGAITEYSWKKLKKKFIDFKGNIIIEHPLNIRIEMKELKSFLDEKALYSRIRFTISTIAVNSYSPYNDHIDVSLLRKEIRKVFDNNSVIDVTEVVGL